MSQEKRVAISVESVSKDFKLPHHNQPSSIKSIFVNPFRKSEKKPREYNEKQHALKDITFNIHEGEFFGIVGRNGSGKSTLLKIIAGIYKPNQGKVQYSGKLVPFIELGVGFNPELSGRDNVFLSGALMGYSTKEIEAKYQDIVAFAELERFMDQLLKNHSSGMQVRLAFSVATIMGDSDILLIDEVLAVGDADFQRKCFSYFKELKRNRKTVVFVSHDMEAVREYCDRCVLIDENKAKMIGSSSEVAKAYTKLFNQRANEISSSSGRWGNARAKTDKVKVTVGSSTVGIEHSVESTEDLDEYEVGFRIRNLAGQSLVGTNSKLERITPPKLIAGAIAVFTWEVPNIFGDGTYIIDVAIVASDGVTVIEWFDDVTRFDVRRNRRSPYPFDPEIKLSYKN